MAIVSSSREVYHSVGYRAQPLPYVKYSYGTDRLSAIGSGDDVKSACPLYPGRHTCYNGADKGLPSSNAELIPETASQWGLRAAIRPHERGIGSNRGSAKPR